MGETTSKPKSVELAESGASDTEDLVKLILATMADVLAERVRAPAGNVVIDAALKLIEIDVAMAAIL